MKLLRYGPPGREQPGLLDADGHARSIAGVVDDIDGNAISPEGLARLRGINPAELPLLPQDTRIGPCLGGVGKLIGIGLNYSDHAAEANMPVPREPIFFMKATSCIAGPYDPVILPADASKADWEVELAFAIGTRAKNVPEDRALSHVAGYCILNDISERGWQIEREGQWTKGKSHDGFGPMGPWLVTADEISDPGDLAMTLDVSGVRRQTGSTRTMVFGVATLVSYLSRFMTLHPGDVVTTGTPPGVGMGMRPQVWLQDGDVMRLEISGLGHQEQVVQVERA
jgi:2-keto-4-pentenoate hydratase/2-oxohepta-3-ene-1,7-dioic acid hydratase in catechol pathway